MFRVLDVGSDGVTSVSEGGDHVSPPPDDRDITIRAVAKGLDPKATPVKDIMSPDVVWCYESQPVDAVAQLMQQRQVRQVVVLDQDKRVCGIASLGDLATQQSDQQLSAETPEEISEPAR